jgi:hypothetical protein
MAAEFCDINIHATPPFKAVQSRFEAGIALSQQRSIVVVRVPHAQKYLANGVVGWLILVLATHPAGTPPNRNKLIALSWPRRQMRFRRRERRGERNKALFKRGNDEGIAKIRRLRSPDEFE